MSQSLRGPGEEPLTPAKGVDDSRLRVLHFPARLLQHLRGLDESVLGAKRVDFARLH